MSNQQPTPAQGSDMTLNEHIQKQLTDIAKSINESHVLTAQLIQKIEHIETIFNMKVDQNKQEADRKIEDLHRDVHELQRFREKHEDEHKAQEKDKNKMYWGLISTAGFAIASAIIGTVINFS